MSDDDFAEKRQHKRIKPDVQVVARNDDDEEIEAKLLDISGGGASLEVDGLDDLEIMELEINDVGVLSAEISRSGDDSIGVRFLDIDEQEEEMLLADLARLDGSVKFEEL